MLVKLDAFSLQLYINAFLLSHSSSGETFNYVYPKEVDKERLAFLKLMPEGKSVELPVYTPDLTPHMYMNQVMAQLKKLNGSIWAHNHFTIWLHDLLIKQNLFRRTEFDPDLHAERRPDPCIVIKKTGRMKKDRSERTYLSSFEPDLNAEEICVELRRFLRFLHKNLGKSRLLNVITGYHTTITKKSKTQIDIDTFTITTPLQLDIHGTIQEYIRNFAPNRMFTIHLGNPLPGLLTLDNYVKNDANPNEPPILITQSPKSVQDEDETEVVNIDRYNTRSGSLYE